MGTAHKEYWNKKTGEVTDRNERKSSEQKIQTTNNTHRNPPTPEEKMRRESYSKNVDLTDSENTQNI